MDRPTRTVVRPGERLLRCCEYGAFPARSARSPSSARGPCRDQYRLAPADLRICWAVGYGLVRPMALRALSMPPVAAGAAAAL